MFLARRSTQAEYFDVERPPEEFSAFLQTLAKVNRFFVFAEPFQRLLPKLLADAQGASFSLLDLGAGDGALGQALSQWALRRNWELRVTNLDLNPEALRRNPQGMNVAGSVLALPFRSGSFDVVVASQMTHHLTDQEARQHLREAWRVARRAIIVSDLHRNAFLYGGLWLMCRLRRFPATFRHDALLSVQRSWRIPELRRLAEEAGIPDAKTGLYFGARVLLQARKPAGAWSQPRRRG